MVYQSFARIYDNLMDKSLYEKWLKYTTRRIDQPAKILELASGTGDLSVRLLQQGYDVTLSDISVDMLELASNKLAENYLTANIWQLDMRDFSSNEAFDAIICYDDSICYLADEDELSQTVKNCAKALRIGGKFLFDCHSLKQIDEIFPGYTYTDINDDYTFAWESFVGDKPHSIVHVLQTFVPASDGYYRLHEEDHKERTYPITTYQKILAANHFHVRSLTSDFTESFDRENGRRWFFECEKVE